MWQQKTPIQLHRKYNLNIKTINFVLMLTLAILISAWPTLVQAEGVNMGVNIVARKSTDTINDFDFSSLNQLVNFSDKRIAGASTANLTMCLKDESKTSHTISFWQKIIRTIKL